MKCYTAIILLLIVPCIIMPQEIEDVFQQADQIIGQAHALLNEEKRSEAIALLLENKEFFTSANILSSMYGCLSWFYLFTEEYKEAEEAALGGILLDSEAGWIKVNLAHALFLQGRYQEASILYGELSNTLERDYETYTLTIIDDLEFLEYKGIITAKYIPEITKLRLELESILEKEQLLSEAIAHYDEAEYNEAIEILESLKDNIDRRSQLFPICICYMADSYYEIMQYSSAEYYYLELKAICEQMYGTEHPDYAITINSLGSLYRDLGDYAKAESYYLEAKAIYERMYGTEHPDYTTVLNNPDLLYKDLGDSMIENN